MGVLEQPMAVGSTLGADAIDRLGEPWIRGAATPGEVLRGLEQVVVPARWVGEQVPLRIDLLARPQRPEQVASEQVLLTLATGFEDLLRSRAVTLPTQQCVQHVQS